MKSLLRFLPALLMLPLASAKPPADTQARLDEWAMGLPGGAAVAWVDADGTAFFQTGQFSTGDARKITPDTQFEIGSISKVFTALLLAESERAGKVNRLDAAAKYLLPANDPAQKDLAKITLLSLTTHASGLPKMPGNSRSGAYKPDDPYATYDRASLVAALRTEGREAVVGRSAVYSNFGVSVLGEALGAAWGGSYAEALHDHVLQPLGMKATTVGLASLPPPDGLAPAHRDGRMIANWTFLAMAPAGALRSSSRDMAIFLQACLGGGGALLHEAMAMTFQRQRNNDQVGGGIGLGWMLRENPALPIIWHNGATGGSHAFVGFSPKTGAGVVILANDEKSSDALGFSLLGVKQATPPAPVSVKNAADYLGRYPLSPEFAIEITEAKGQLVAQATGQSPFALRELAADRFAIAKVGAEISFERDAAGQVTGLVLHQGGQDKPGKKTK